jgi:DNA-binding protein YbaB
MFNRLKQFSELAKLRGELKAIQKELKKEEVVLEERGFLVVVAGDRTVKRIKIEGKEQPVLVELLNKALKKAQKIEAKKAMERGDHLLNMLGQG